MKTIPFNEFMSAPHLDLKWGIDNFFQMSPVMKNTYIGLITLGSVVIVSAVVSSKWKDGHPERAEKLDLFVTVTLMTGALGSFIWLILKNSFVR